jgi:hypothetical protein
MPDMLPLVNSSQEYYFTAGRILCINYFVCISLFTQVTSASSLVFSGKYSEKLRNVNE